MKHFFAASLSAIAAASAVESSYAGADVTVLSSSTNNYTVSRMTYGANTPSYIKSEFVQQEGSAMVLILHSVHSMHNEIFFLLFR